MPRGRMTTWAVRPGLSAVVVACSVNGTPAIVRCSLAFARRCAIHVAAGRVKVAGEGFTSGQLLAFRPGDEIVVTAEEESRVLLIGGVPLDGPRHVWWNFVSSSTERIEQAKADWKGGRFPLVPYETEFIPLPDA